MKTQVKQIKISEGKVFVSPFDRPIEPIIGHYDIGHLGHSDFYRHKQEFEQLNKTFLESFVEVSNPGVIVLQNGCLIGGYTPLDGFYPAPTGLEIEVKYQIKSLLREFDWNDISEDGYDEGSDLFRKIATVSFSEKPNTKPL